MFCTEFPGMDPEGLIQNKNTSSRFLAAQNRKCGLNFRFFIRNIQDFHKFRDAVTTILFFGQKDFWTDDGGVQYLELRPPMLWNGKLGQEPQKSAWCVLTKTLVVTIKLGFASQDLSPLRHFFWERCELKTRRPPNTTAKNARNSKQAKSQRCLDKFN